MTNDLNSSSKNHFWCNGNDSYIYNIMGDKLLIAKFQL